jgi:hypothetical protein
MGRRLGCAAFLLALAVSPACSDDTSTTLVEADAQVDPGGEPGESESVVPPESTTSSTLPDLGVELTAAESECVAREMSADDELAQRMAVERCVRLVTFGPTLVEGLQASAPGLYTDEQLACILNAYARLSGEDIEALIAAGLSPGGDNAAEAEEVMVSLFESCDLPMPAGAPSDGETE